MGNHSQTSIYGQGSRALDVLTRFNKEQLTLFKMLDIMVCSIGFKSSEYAVQQDEASAFALKSSAAKRRAGV